MIQHLATDTQTGIFKGPEARIWEVKITQTLAMGSRKKEFT